MSKKRDKVYEQSRLAFSPGNPKFDIQKSDMKLLHFFDVCSALKPCTLVANSCSTFPEMDNVRLDGTVRRN